MTSYTTKQDAIQAEIIDVIEASGVATADEYDIDAIADQVLTSEGTGFEYRIVVDETVDFWAVVEALAGAGAFPREGGHMERMTGAEFAAHRHLIGLTLDELADTLGVNPRTTRAWETGRDLIPARIPAELGALVAEHGRLAE